MCTVYENTFPLKSPQVSGTATQRNPAEKAKIRRDTQGNKLSDSASRDQSDKEKKRCIGIAKKDGESQTGEWSQVLILHLS